MNEPEEVVEDCDMNDAEKIKAALDIAMQSGGVDGAHHKAWVIDQMVRILAGDGYETWVEEHNHPGDAPGDEYEWDVGISP